MARIVGRTTSDESGTRVGNAETYPKRDEFEVMDYNSRLYNSLLRKP